MSTERIKELENLIIKHRFLYYSGNPIISDPEYDKLEKELEKLDKNNKLFTEVGFNVANSTFSKIKHSIKMPSQGKVYNQDEFNSWFPKEIDEFVQSYKIDGFAITLKYKFNPTIGKYMLKYGATRGDGNLGEDITENIKTIQDIPITLDIPLGIADSEIEVRGEIYMKKSVFAKIKDEAMKEENKEYKTPRNLASGSARNKNSAITKKRNLNFFCYDVIGFHINSYVEKLQVIQSLGIPIVSMKRVYKNDIWESHLNNEKIRPTLDYDIDGTVVRINSNSKYDELGETSHHARGSVAIKFSYEKEQSILKEVVWETSRTGLINPVAIIEPVELGGATITRATLHNLSYIEELGLNIGCDIIMARMGDVIPKIIEKVKDNPNDTKIKIPHICPSCGELTKINISDGGVKTLVCENKNCPAIKLAEFEHFVDQMGMKGLAVETLDKLIKAGFLKEFADLFKLSVPMIMSLDGFKKRSAENIFNAIQSNRKKPFAVFLSSLGISGLGKSVSKLVAKEFTHIQALWADQMNSHNRLCKMDGVAEKTARSIIEGAVEKQQIITNLLEYVEFSDDSSSVGCLSGMLFCVSGSMTNGKDSIYKLIEQYGGVVKSSVVKNLNYLIAGDGSGNKSKQADEYGIPIITEEAFMDMIGHTKVEETITPKSKDDNLLDWLN
jgi:DNA ligase (NAD+)